MSHFNFVTPLSRDDLFEASARDQYVVENVFTCRDLKVKLADTKVLVQQQGAAFVLGEGFDVIFSMLQEYNKEATPVMKELAFTILGQGMTSLVENLSTVLTQGKLPETEERITWLNTFKMLTYLYTQMIEEVEGDQLRADPLTGGKAKAGKKKSTHDDFTWDWDVERGRCVVLLYNLLQLNLNSLFDPPMIEEEVVNCVANTLFKMLENPVLSHVKTKDVRLSIIQVLGTLNKKFNYTLSCSLKFVQLLKHFEHLVSVFSQATEVLTTEYGCSGMVMEMVREIARIDHRELARDTSGTRSFSLFLVELAEKIPESMKPCIPLLTTHLDGESYTMRKCVLGVLGEIVARVLSGEELDEAGRDDRDCFLDCLADHMHDCHAHVRSYVLSVWSKLCAEKHIPLARQHIVLERAAGRLRDKTSSVRKAAVQLLTCLLESNPFAAKLETQDLEVKLAQEREKLQALQGDEVREPVELWSEMKDKVREQLKKDREEADDEEEESIEVWEGASMFEVCERIAGFLEKMAISKARSLLTSAQKNLETDEVFKFQEVEAEPMDQEDNDKEDDDKEEDDKEEDDSSKEDSTDEKIMVVFQKVFLEAKRKPEVSASQQSQTVTTQDELNKQKLLVKFLSDSVKFSQTINTSLPNVAMLLGSKQSTDILEAIEFFVRAFEFGLINAMLGVRKMLSLIWSREPTIKDAVVAAYKRLYIDVENAKTRNGHVLIARNFLALISGATLGELTSLEKLVGELVETKDLGKGVFTVLWEYFTGVLPDSSPDKSRAAIMLLGMCSQSEVSIISSNVQVIIDHGLGDRGLEDLRLAQHSCEALLRMAPTKLKQDDPNPPAKMLKDCQLFKRLEILLISGLDREETTHYLPMAQNALALIFLLGEAPDTYAGDILKRVCVRVKDSQTDVEGQPKVPTFLLRRLCFLAGHVSLCLLNYLDVSVFTELKRRNTLRELKAKKDSEEKEKARKEKKKKRQSLAHALETPRTAAEEDEMGCVGAEADDAEAEFIRNVCEKEILSTECLLGSLASLLITVCSNPSKYTDSDLRSCASLALSKFMLVSSEFCEKNLQLLFTVLEKAVEPVIRANLIIALGDLSNRFPNTVEPWTPKMYARLHDEDSGVRINTLTVLTHLILNDMIKVKGQISDVAFCIVDGNERISGLSKLFFAELAKKGNTLYNVMPDIVSRLSDPEVGIDEEFFRTIMKYIIGLIEKDKLVENLVEKLCHRFRATRTQRQWRDIAFCLSLLPYSDRGLKKLNENLGCWSDKLHEDFVYESICVIFAGVKKSASIGSAAAAGNKQEIKALLEEMEQKVEEFRSKGVEDDTANKRAKEAQDEKKGKSAKKSDKKDEPSDDENENPETENTEPSGSKSPDSKSKTPVKQPEEINETRSKAKSVNKSPQKKIAPPTRRTRRGRREEEQEDSEND